MKRIPLRLQKAYDTFEIKFGSAGFVKVYRNGKQITHKNKSITIRRRKNDES